MPAQRTPAAARLGSCVTSRRHAELLLHSGVDVSVKDLRLRRVVPPASGFLYSSPECAEPVKPGSVESTPPEAVSAAAAAEVLDRKPVLPRSKLVRDPASFGYRRLLPFLNEMAKNDSSIGMWASSENTAAQSKDELNRSDIRLVDESLGETHCESEAADSVEPVLVKTGGEPEVQDGCNSVTEETNTVAHDLASSKPWFARCTRSRFVHHPSSFSYKRMLPFLMESEISSLEGDRVKIRRVAEERQLPSDEIHASSKECNSSSTEVMEEEKPSEANGNDVLDGRQLQPPVPKASPSECSAAEVQNVMEQETLTSSEDPPTSCEGELTSDGNDVQSGGHHELVISQDSPEECNGDEIKKTVQDKAVTSYGSYGLDSNKLQPSVSEVFPENSAAEVQKAPQEPLPLDGDDQKSNKGDHLAKEQPQSCVTKESLTGQLQDNAECAEALQCQNSNSGCQSFLSPTKTVLPLLGQHCEQECQDAVASLDDPLLDIGIVCRPSDPCAVDRSLSVEELSGCVPLTESGPSKAGIIRPGGDHSMEKRGLSPKRISPKKGILKRHTRGCKGICMCLDCCTFRLRADRAFEFSRKQMQEADDIINNLLKEVANLRSLVEKPANQGESTQAACRRASRVEEVARDRCQQMFVDLNSHCRIPGPRVRFAQYVEEKKALSSPRSGNRR